MPEEPGLAWRAVSVAGFLLLVGAYLVNAMGRCQASSRRYLVANAVGAGVLAIYSAVIDEPVFVALEGFWCAASVWALLVVKAPRDNDEAHSGTAGAPRESARDAARDSAPGAGRMKMSPADSQTGGA